MVTKRDIEDIVEAVISKSKDKNYLYRAIHKYAEIAHVNINHLRKGKDKDLDYASADKAMERLASLMSSINTLNKTKDTAKKNRIKKRMYADLVDTQSAIETFNESVDDKGLRVIIRKLYDLSNKIKQI